MFLQVVERIFDWFIQNYEYDVIKSQRLGQKAKERYWKFGFIVEDSTGGFFPTLFLFSLNLIFPVISEFDVSGMAPNVYQAIETVNDSYVLKKTSDLPSTSIVQRDLFDK